MTLTSEHPLHQKLLLLMQEKQTNLALSLDVTKREEFLYLADLLGSEICVLKTHMDILEDFDATLITALEALAKKHRFLIFEDRKFADIGETVKKQFSSGVFNIAKWADIVNAHAVAGPGIIDSLRSVARPGTGVLLMAQMSSKGNLLTPDVTDTVVAWADNNPDFVLGFITQRKLSAKHAFIYMTPGVHLDKTGDGNDQQFRTPHKAIVEHGCDIIIVGRAIYAANDPLVEAKRYRHAGWEAYCATKNLEHCC